MHIFIFIFFFKGIPPTLIPQVPSEHLKSYKDLCFVINADISHHVESLLLACDI